MDSERKLWKDDIVVALRFARNSVHHQLAEALEPRDEPNPRRRGHTCMKKGCGRLSFRTKARLRLCVVSSAAKASTASTATRMSRLLGSSGARRSAAGARSSSPKTISSEHASCSRTKRCRRDHPVTGCATPASVRVRSGSARTRRRRLSRTRAPCLPGAASRRACGAAHGREPLPSGDIFRPGCRSGR
jgi:hypothetical protein